jgi:hypothetical protein
MSNKLPTKEINNLEFNLRWIYGAIGIDVPENHDEILNFVIADIEDTADESYTSEDIRIAFRRFLETKTIL